MKIVSKPPIEVLVGDLSDLQFKELSVFRDKNRAAFRWWLDPYSEVAQWALRWKDCQSMSPIGINDDHYVFNWDLDQLLVTYAPIVLKSLYIRSVTHNIRFLYLSASSFPKNHLVLFEESHIDSSLPKDFLKIPAFPTCAELSDFCMKEGLISFSITDKSRFDQDALLSRQQGTFVGQERSTGDFWYLDQLHKDHYEVFSRHREHKGEADLNGELIPGTKVKGRVI